MFRTTYLKKFLLSGSVYAATAVTSAGSAEGTKGDPSAEGGEGGEGAQGAAEGGSSKSDSGGCDPCTGKLLRRTDLPLYDDSHPPDIKKCDDKPSSLEKNVSAVRKELWVWHDKYKGYHEKIVEVIETGKAHTSEDPSQASNNAKSCDQGKTNENNPKSEPDNKRKSKKCETGENGSENKNDTKSKITQKNDCVDDCDTKTNKKRTTNGGVSDNQKIPVGRKDTGECENAIDRKTSANREKSAGGDSSHICPHCGKTTSTCMCGAHGDNDIDKSKGRKNEKSDNRGSRDSGNSSIDSRKLAKNDLCPKYTPNENDNDPHKTQEKESLKRKCDCSKVLCKCGYNVNEEKDHKNEIGDKRDSRDSGGNSADDRKFAKNDCIPKDKPNENNNDPCKTQERDSPERKCDCKKVSCKCGQYGEEDKGPKSEYGDNYVSRDSGDNSTDNRKFAKNDCSPKYKPNENNDDPCKTQERDSPERKCDCKKVTCKCGQYVEEDKGPKSEYGDNYVSRDSGDNSTDNRKFAKNDCSPKDKPDENNNDPDKTQESNPPKEKCGCHKLLCKCNSK